jgi:hypothetical protein
MVLVVVNPMRRMTTIASIKGEDGEEDHHSQHSYGLTGHFWIKLFENTSLERSFGYAEEEF